MAEVDGLRYRVEDVQRRVTHFVADAAPLIRAPDPRSGFGTAKGWEPVSRDGAHTDDDTAHEHCEMQIPMIDGGFSARAPVVPQGVALQFRGGDVGPGPGERHGRRVMNALRSQFRQRDAVSSSLFA